MFAASEQPCSRIGAAIQNQLLWVLEGGNAQVLDPSLDQMDVFLLLGGAEG